MPVPDERRDSLWWLVAPVATWTAHFGASYALVAVGCPRLSAGLVYGGLAGATIVAIAVLGGVGWRGWQGWRRAAQAPSAPAARHRFLSVATLLLAALGAAAVAYDLGGIALVGGCR